MSDMLAAISTADNSLGVGLRSVMTGDAPNSLRFSMEAWCMAYVRMLMVSTSREPPVSVAEAWKRAEP